MSRPGGRRAEALREVTLELDAAPYAEGSCLIRFGDTAVLCAASVSEEVPRWRRGAGLGWVTAEYAMLPRSTHRRTSRERAVPRGRTQEIQRLIGRSLRTAVDLEALGERQIIVDCDVLGADGGTRTAAITGAAVALARACEWLVAEGLAARSPMRELVAAVSVGVVDGEVRLDLEYVEDSAADVDLNLVGLESGGIVEVQGTGEQVAFSRQELDVMLDLGLDGIRELLAAQRRALSDGSP
ncbi:MAG: ribonuclease PH [Gemmatimonadota bacterium]